jgi:hypothetical protein
MSNLFLLFTFLYAIKFPYTFKLKKDELLKLHFFYLGRKYPFSMRWTLYKNEIITILYRYDNFPRQVELYPYYPVNRFKIKIVDYSYFNTPYVWIVFDDFKDGVATFTMYRFGDEIQARKDKK